MDASGQVHCTERGQKHGEPVLSASLELLSLRERRPMEDQDPRAASLWSLCPVLRVVTGR